MIAVWPVGATLGLAILLWRNRAKLNPALSADERSVLADSNVRESGFERAHTRYVSALEQIRKLEIRNKDNTISGLEFLFEEYEPRCYLFPVFELARRLFLSSVLAVIYPGSTRQVIIGLLGAMLSCIVYFYYEAFIEDDDDVVSAVAQVQLVLVYFAALAIYAADGQDEKEAAFSGVAFGVVLLLIFFASYVVAAYVTLLEIFGYSSLRSVYAGLFTRNASSAAAHQSSAGNSVPAQVIPSDLHDGTSIPLAYVEDVHISDPQDGTSGIIELPLLSQTLAQ